MDHVNHNVPSNLFSRNKLYLKFYRLCSKAYNNNVYEITYATKSYLILNRLCLEVMETAYSASGDFRFSIHFEKKKLLSKVNIHNSYHNNNLGRTINFHVCWTEKNVQLGKFGGRELTEEKSRIIVLL